jgi:hypothetical protein
LIKVVRIDFLLTVRLNREHRCAAHGHHDNR